MHIYQIFLICLSIVSYLHWFSTFSILNHAEIMDMDLAILYAGFFSFAYIYRSGIGESHDSSIFSIWGKFSIVCHIIYTNLYPHKDYKNSLTPHCCQYVLFYFIFVGIHSNKDEMELLYCSECMSSWFKDNEFISMYLLNSWISSFFWESSVQVACL